LRETSFDAMTFQQPSKALGHGHNGFVGLRPEPAPTYRSVLR
jgi:hypothetical protein